MSAPNSRIIIEKSVVKFTLRDVPDQPGIAAEIFNRLHSAEINALLVVQTARGKSTADLALVVSSDDIRKTVNQLSYMVDIVQENNIVKEEQVALVTLEMANLARSHGIAARMFRILAGQGINIDLISTSLNSITCLISENRANDALTALEKEFTS